MAELSWYDRILNSELYDTAGNKYGTAEDALASSKNIKDELNLFGKDTTPYSTLTQLSGYVPEGLASSLSGIGSTIGGGLSMIGDGSMTKGAGVLGNFYNTFVGLGSKMNKANLENANLTNEALRKQIAAADTKMDSYNKMKSGLESIRTPVQPVMGS